MYSVIHYRIHRNPHARNDLRQNRLVMLRYAVIAQAPASRCRSVIRPLSPRSRRLLAHFLIPMKTDASNPLQEVDPGPGCVIVLVICLGFWVAVLLGVYLMLGDARS